VSVDTVILGALGHLGERHVYAVPLELARFVHLTGVKMSMFHAPEALSADVANRIARCESPRGQLVCSCGRFALAWPEPPC